MKLDDTSHEKPVDDDDDETGITWMKALLAIVIPISILLILILIGLCLFKKRCKPKSQPHQPNLASGNTQTSQTPSQSSEADTSNGYESINTLSLRSQNDSYVDMNSTLQHTTVIHSPVDQASNQNGCITHTYLHANNGRLVASIQSDPNQNDIQPETDGHRYQNLDQIATQTGTDGQHDNRHHFYVNVNDGGPNV